jgi:hypothetical protein
MTHPKASELLGAGDNMKLELNDQERRAVGNVRAERKVPLIGKRGRYNTLAAQRLGSLEGCGFCST